MAGATPRPFQARRASGSGKTVSSSPRSCHGMGSLWYANIDNMIAALRILESRPDEVLSWILPVIGLPFGNPCFAACSFAGGGLGAIAVDWRLAANDSPGLGSSVAAQPR